ncbi:MAG TPA: cysteine dioxygenase family protein [Candidatus Baltobacteraceae bacterium]|jgi:predicted metal-dependent enzyme (double-stranded beta helix superfamily)|nr:cysteine dioxygenase family protein [Candidatus Baltobacteraceae bacterium]
MIAPEPVSRLARTLDDLRNGQASPEIVRWLRAQREYALGLPAPPCGPHGYTRSLLYKSERFEVLVLHWKPGCATSIHDHGGANCWFAVCEGVMHVENFRRFDSGQTAGYARIGLEGREQLRRGDLDYRQDDVHLHRCIAGEQPVTTLHVYAAPIERFRIFEERTESCAETSCSYDAILTAF